MYVTSNIIVSDMEVNDQYSLQSFASLLHTELPVKDSADEEVIASLLLH